MTRRFIQKKITDLHGEGIIGVYCNPILKSIIILLCATLDLDFEDISSSRQSIEGRLVEEYRNSSYSSDTRAELDRIVQEKECILCPKSRTITYNSSFFHKLRWVLKRTFQNLMLNPQTSVAQVDTSSVLALT